MADLVLQVKLRDLQNKPKKLRREAMVPAVLYGHKVKNVFLIADRKEFQKVFQEAGESSLIDLTIEKEKKPRKVLVKEVQRDPVSGEYLHIDFYEVKMTEKITAEAPLEFKGVSRAVKDLDGVLVKSLDEIEVSCLPQDLPHSILVSISSLKTFDDVIHVKDLDIPKNVEVLAHPEDVVVSVMPPRSEKELEELEEKVEEKVEEVEGVKKEGEEGAESEAGGEPGAPEEAGEKQEDAK
ncbi:MAG: 50S ribosomal protein L25 [Patescibacteria group bacterium]|nr:50S ribosomal protein L25 [Patescibacteria group bacterium]